MEQKCYLEKLFKLMNGFFLSSSYEAEKKKERNMTLMWRYICMLWGLILSRHYCHFHIYYLCIPFFLPLMHYFIYFFKQKC